MMVRGLASPLIHSNCADTAWVLCRCCA